MIKIFDEIKYIEDFIQGDFKNTSHWLYDIGIFVRWRYKDKNEFGYTRKKVKEELIKKCEKSFYWFDYRVYFETIETIMKKNWKKTPDFISVKEIRLTDDMIKWFAEQNLKKNELKLLFTLYIGYRIKKFKTQYNDDSCRFFNKITDNQFFRQNGNLSTSTAVLKLFKQFYPLGYVTKPCGKYFSITFLNNDIFNINLDKIEYKKENTLLTNDFDNIGDWIWNRLNGFRLCKRCGKMIPKIKNKQYCDKCIKEEKDKPKLKRIVCSQCGKEFKTYYTSNKEILCPECSKLNKYTPIETKIIKCIDCGKEFKVDATANNNIRCPKCSKLNKYTPIETKIICKSCGKEFIKKGNTRRELCEICYKQLRKEYKAKKEKERRKLKK